MRLVETRIAEVRILETDVHEDDRGYLTESYNLQTFEALGLPERFIQDNHTYSAKAGTIRAFGYQLSPKAQTKLVRVLTGAIYDVAVDIRRFSPSFGQWVGVLLSESNRRQLVVPKGFAHGYCTLAPRTQVLVKVDEHLSPEHDRGLLWCDPDLKVDWPARVPVVSEKDQSLPLLKDIESNFMYQTEEIPS